MTRKTALGDIYSGTHGNAETIYRRRPGLPPPPGLRRKSGNLPDIVARYAAPLLAVLLSTAVALHFL